jgi:thiol:disulfide interchange protein DsbA
MNRRDFVLTLPSLPTLPRAAAMPTLLPLLPVAAAAQGGPQEGQHYFRLPQPAPTALAGEKKVEVVEFFWYECSACNAVAPMIHAWSGRLPPDVQLRYVHVGFNARYQLMQRVFYTLEAMGELQRLHPAIFVAIHAQGRRLTLEPELTAFLRANNVDPVKYGETAKSFQVATAMNRANQLSAAYKVDGVPMLGVQGRWFTSPQHAGGAPQALAVVEHLIQRARTRA